MIAILKPDILCDLWKNIHRVKKLRTEQKTEKLGLLLTPWGGLKLEFIPKKKTKRLLFIN